MGSDYTLWNMEWNVEYGIEYKMKYGWNVKFRAYDVME